ncbi:hypothetical protein quinque_007112 [Culex quinquefasciatus]
MTFPNPSEKYLPDTVGCNYPIQEHHNWSLVNLQLPAVADPANPDWKDMFRKSVDHPSCLQLRVSYTINQNIGLHFLDIGVECHGEPKTHPVKFQMMDRVQGSEGFFLSVEYRGGGVALDPDCIKFGSQQQFELEDNSFIRQPWCLRFKVDYIIQEDIGLVEIRIVVVCGARRMHALRIIVDSYDSTATKVFEFNEQNHILQGNCSDMVDVMLKLTVNSKLRILRNSPYSFLVLGAESNDVRFSESRCDCSGFERFERRLSWCGGAIFRDKFFGKRFYVIMSVLLGTGLLVTISLSACNLIQNPAR